MRASTLRDEVRPHVSVDPVHQEVDRRASMQLVTREDSLKLCPVSHHRFELVSVPTQNLGIELSDWVHFKQVV